MARQQDPHPAFRFEVRIDDLASGGFCECSGLEARTDFVEYREGGVNDRVHRFVAGAQQAILILRRGVVDRELFDWHAELDDGKVRPRGGSIQVFDATGRHLLTEWRFERALPVAWIGPRLDAHASRVAIETFELAPERLFRTR